MSCEWCGSNDNLHRHHVRNQKDKIISFKKYQFQEYKKIQPPKPNNWKKLSYDHKCKIGKKNWNKFLGSKKIQENLKIEWANLNKESIEAYKKFSPDDIIILCNRCHFAIHHNSILCPKCKQKYTKYSECYDCLLKEYNVASEIEKELIAEAHPGFMRHLVMKKWEEENNYLLEDEDEM